jgi:hypothetical protein
MLMKRGAPMMVMKSRSNPCAVPPRDRTMIERMNVVSRTGIAISHAPKPTKGTSEIPHVTNSRIQPALAGPLHACPSGLPQFGQAVADAETCVPQSAHGVNVGFMFLVFLAFSPLGKVVWPCDFSSLTTHFRSLIICGYYTHLWRTSSTNFQRIKLFLSACEIGYEERGVKTAKWQNPKRIRTNRSST